MGKKTDNGIRELTSTGGTITITPPGGQGSVVNIEASTSAGNVTGPASSVNNLITNFSGTTGKVLNNTSGVTLVNAILTGIVAPDGSDGIGSFILDCSQTQTVNKYNSFGVLFNGDASFMSLRKNLVGTDNQRFIQFVDLNNDNEYFSFDGDTSNNPVFNMRSSSYFGIAAGSSDALLVKFDSSGGILSAGFDDHMVNDGVTDVGDVNILYNGTLFTVNSSSQFFNFANGTIILNTNAVQDSVGSAGTAGQSLTSTGTSTLWATTPQIVASSHLTGKSAAISATTIYAVPANRGGQYRISWVASVTSVATASCVLGGSTGFQAIYTNLNDSVVKTTNPTVVSGFTSNTNATSTTVTSSLCVYAKAGTNIQYAFGYTSSGASPMQYDLNIIVESLF